MVSRHPTLLILPHPSPSSHPHSSLYSSQPIHTTNSRSSSAMNGHPNNSHFPFNGEQFYHPPPRRYEDEEQHAQEYNPTTSISPGHLTLTAPAGTNGFGHSDSFMYGHPQQSNRWPDITSTLSHSQSIPAHDAGNVQLQSQSYQVLPPHSQAQMLAYNNGLPMATPPLNNMLISPNVQAMHNSLLHRVTAESYQPASTAPSWPPMQLPTTAGPHMDTISQYDPRQMIGDDPSNLAAPAVGRQGTRGILPSAPGKEDPILDHDIEPLQDPETKKWLCPSCPATFSFPKHVKRHYMRHTGERPYECLCCSTCFARSDVLKRHFEKCSERTPGWRDLPHESRADHLQGRRGRPKRAGKKHSGKKKSSQTDSAQPSRRNSDDTGFGDGGHPSFSMTASH